MNFIQDSNFDDFIEKYKKLNLADKKEELEKNLKEMLVVLSSLNQKFGNSSDVLINREINDLKKEYVSEDDFVEAMYVYVYSIKESLGILINGFDKED